MDLIRATVALRDRDLLEVFDLALRFCARHAKKLAIVSSISIVPWLVVCLLVRDDIDPIYLWLFALGSASIATLPVTALASRLVFDETATVRDALTIALRALPRAVGVRVIQASAFALTIWFVFVPVWVGSVLLFAPEVALLEKVGAFAACTRSHKLASRRTGESILAFVLLVLLQLASAPLGDHVLRTICTELLDATPPPSLWTEGISSFALVGFFAAAPLLALARFFLYLNARTRTEGWDVQTRFVAIAQRHEASA